MRMIDADEAIVNFGFEWDDICPTRDEVVSFLRKQKTIDAVPVVHGEWVERALRPTCSLCGFSGSLIDAPISPFKYCPNCGAKMDGDKQ